MTSEGDTCLSPKRGESESEETSPTRSIGPVLPLLPILGTAYRTEGAGLERAWASEDERPSPFKMSVVRKAATKVHLLLGVLDRRDFERVNKELGKCDLCGEGGAVSTSKELRMSI